MRTFMDDLRVGWTTAEDIDVYIERWHNRDEHDRTDGGDISLHEFLGLTWDEYRQWAEGGALPITADSRKDNL